MAGEDYGRIFEAVPVGRQFALPAGEIAELAGVGRRACGTKLTAMVRGGYAKLGLRCRFDGDRQQNLWWRDGSEG